MEQSSWLVPSAALAIALMVGFYAPALGIAAALPFIPGEAYANDVRVPARIALLCVPGTDRLSPGGMPRV